MPYIADLHIHSTASDGQYSPTQLVKMAKERGLEFISLTDHDTIDGLEEAIHVGEKLSLCVIPGIELSAKEYPTFHILGYGFALNASALGVLCHRMKANRDDRTKRLLTFLKKRGIELNSSEVEKMARGNIIGRPHFAQVMVHRGYVASNREAFDRFLDT